MRQSTRAAWAAILVLALLGAPVGEPAADPAALGVLLEGVSEIGAPGVPGALCPFGDEAFAVVAGGSGNGRQVVVAAARLGEGRVAAFGHGGYFGGEALAAADTSRLMLNAARWLAGGDEPRVAVDRAPALLAALREAGVEALAVEGPLDGDALAGYNVVAGTHLPGLVEADLAPLEAFIRDGGGLLTAHTPWGWLQLNPGKTLADDHGGNRLLARAGLIWVDGTVGRTSPQGYAAGEAPAELLHAGRALEALEQHAAGRQELGAGDLALASSAIIRAAQAMPPGDALLLPRLERIRADYEAGAVPTPTMPLKSEHALERLALTLSLTRARGQAPDETAPHPSAEAFPGAVPPEAPRVTRTLTVNTGTPGWQSTGLYAAPGEIIRVSLPEAAAGLGLQAQIGCHSDRLWHLAEWKRVPEIIRRAALAGPVTALASPFGGLVYVDVPRGIAPEEVVIEVAGAVEAPLFVLGRTDPVQWREEVRGRPAPWAELAAPQVVVTVPSEVIRDLDNPVPLMEFWAHVLDTCATLAARPLERERPERIVADVQISAGYMHSGYPIMTHLDAASVAVDLERLQTRGSWGHFHEIGHNHQSGDWTFGGAGEVTVNLFTLYVMHRCARVQGPGHPQLEAETRDRKIREYLAAGAPFERWKADPFLALNMYSQLQQAFGWEAFKETFAWYRRLPDAGRPQTDEQKRDMWMVSFSRTVGRNLGPFFETWGVPTTQAAREEIAHLPAWMPEGFPPE